MKIRLFPLCFFISLRRKFINTCRLFRFCCHRNNHRNIDTVFLVDSPCISLFAPYLHIPIMFINNTLLHSSNALAAILLESVCVCVSIITTAPSLLFIFIMLIRILFFNAAILMSTVFGGTVAL